MSFLCSLCYSAVLEGDSGSLKEEENCYRMNENKYPSGLETS